MIYRITSESTGITRTLDKQHKTLIENLGYKLHKNNHACFIDIPYGDFDNFCQHIFNSINKAVRCGDAEITILQEPAYKPE